METMHAAGRRTLPPVPRATGDRLPAPSPAAAGEPAGDTPTERFVVDLTTGEQRAIDAGPASPGAAEDVAPEAGRGPAGASPAAAAPEAPERDAAQQFVARLRAAAPEFAAAAGAESAAVREVVPPARHRRSRCRLVLRYAEDAEVDVTFLGPAGPPESPSRHGFDRQIRRWLKAGQRREDAWLVADAEATGGLAVDLGAWVAAA
jgi:hypothetical protein